MTQALARYDSSIHCIFNTSTLPCTALHGVRSISRSVPSASISKNLPCWSSVSDRLSTCALGIHQASTTTGRGQPLLAENRFRIFYFVVLRNQRGAHGRYAFRALSLPPGVAMNHVVLVAGPMDFMEDRATYTFCVNMRIASPSQWLTARHGGGLPG